MMLQAIHTEKGSPQASSLYCRWIRVEHREGAQLVAVWMDSEMRAFESEFNLAEQTEESGQEIVQTHTVDAPCQGVLRGQTGKTTVERGETR